MILFVIGFRLFDTVGPLDGKPLCQKCSVYLKDIHGIFWEPLADLSKVGQWPLTVLMAADLCY